METSSEDLPVPYCFSDTGGGKTGSSRWNMEIADVYFEIHSEKEKKEKEKTGVTQPVGHGGVS